MAVYLNAKGSTNASFQIGKRGSKFFGGVNSPDASNVVDGDIWLDNANGDVKIASVSNGIVTWSNMVASGDSFSATDLTVTGNLTVNGTQTVINTTTLDVEDNIITLNSNFTGADNVVDAGIEVNRGDEPNVSLLWDEAEGEWTLGSEQLVAGGFIGNLHGNVIGSLAPNGVPNSVVANVLNADNATISNIAYPTADGTAGQVLTTDGSGNLSFADAFDGAYSSLTGAPTNVSSFTNDSGYITGYTVTEGDVTAHEAALSITKSQVTDLATSDLDLGTNKILYSNVYSTLGDLPDASSYHGMFAHVHATGKAYYAHAGSWVELANVSELFDGAYSSLTGTPSIPTVLTDLSITDGTDGQVLTTDGAGNFTFADASGGTELAVLSTKTLDNPNAYNTRTDDQFGYSVAISGNYAIVGALGEDDAGGTNSGKAYIFNTETGSLLHTLDNPNAFDTSADDYFGKSVSISGNYAIVGVPNEDDAGGTSSGKAYIFNVTDGSLVHTLDNPNAYSTSASDRFGESVAISGNRAIVGAPYEDDAGGSSSGKVYIYDISTFTTSTISSANYVLDNPNPYSTSANDNFGNSVAISGNYAIVGARLEDDAGGSSSGKAYIYDISTFTTSTISSANYVLDNPNAYSTSNGDQFGFSVAISGNYAIVGAPSEDDAGGTSSGKAYVYDISTFTTSTISSASYVLDNPNAYNTSANDQFGYSVAISGNYAIVSAYREDDAGGTDSGKAYIYDISTFTTSTISSASYVLDNPNAYNTSANDHFGFSVAISGNYAIVGAFNEDDAVGSSSGKAYIFRTNGHPYSYSGSEIASFAPASSGGIALTDLSVTQNTASGNGTLSYNNTSGVFTYTPPDLSSYLTSVAFSDLTSTPTTLAGYGITDAFDGAYSSLTGAPTNVSSFTNDAGYLTSETTTTLTADSVNQKLVFTDETGTPNDVDLSWAVDDTNLARLTSGTVNGSTGIATFTRDDATDFTVDFSALFDDTNLTRITSGTVSGNNLTLTRSDATTVVVDVTSLNAETDRYAYEDTKTFVVTVDTKDSTHPQFNNGSANGFKIDGAFAPFIHMVPGMTYRFDQSDASNSGHPLVFYYDENKTTSYTDGVTNNGTPGSAGAYTQIIVSDTTPSTLYYQCSVHSLMGWGANISTHNLTGLDTDDLTEGAGNLYYTTSRFNADFGNKSTSDLSEGTNLYHTTERVRTAINATGDISYNSTTGTISFNNTSGYLTSETYSTASELLTAIKTVDGASSGLEADLLDGQEGSYYLNYSNLSNTPTSILNFGITDGTAGQVLQTDGSGNFSFTTVSGGGGGGVGYTGFEDYFFNVSSQTSTFGTSADAHDKVQVFVNGAYLDDSDFTFNATTGIVTLTTAAESGDEVSVWGFNSTGLSNHELFTVDGSGNITAPGTIQIGNHRKEGSLTSTIASTSPTNVVMYASADYVGSKLIVTVTDTVTGDTQITEALILTVNGGTPKITTYGTMYTSANALASFDVANVSTNTALEVTMASSNSSTVKVAYTLINA